MRKIMLAAALLALGCAAKKTTPLADIPRLDKLDDVMDNQSTAADPQFAKTGAATFSDADFADFGLVGERIQVTSLRVKDFAKGRAEFEALAMTLNEKAKALTAAAAAKNVAGANTALAEMKATCKQCHSKFR
jgi:cytochrome c556